MPGGEGGGGDEDGEEGSQIGGHVGGDEEEGSPSPAPPVIPEWVGVWWALAKEELKDDLRKEMRDLNDDLRTEMSDLKDHISKQVAKSITPISRFLNRTSSSIQIAGTEIPFADGSYPVRDHKLPLLSFYTNISSLGRNQITSYLKGYEIQHVEDAPVAEKKELLRLYLGIQKK